MVLPSELQLISEWRRRSCAVKEAFTAELDARVAHAAALAREVFASGGRLYAFGNGGSASDAQHFVAELVGRFERNRAALPAAAFTANSSDLTAIGNDFGYETVFERQVEAWVTAKDMVVAISTSGNSPNVLRAVEAARKRSAKVVGLTGETGGKLAPLCDILLNVPSRETPRIQEAHIFVLHTIAALIERA